VVARRGAFHLPEVAVRRTGARVEGTVRDRLCVITGANAGIGRATALELGRRGARLVLLGRSEARTQPLLDVLRSAGSPARFVSVDLASLASVRRAADEVLGWKEPIHRLILNAGLAGSRGLTEDGFELAFGVNHLGHYLLTRRLWDLVAGDHPARIIHVSSRAHFDAQGLDWDAFRRPTRSWTGIPEYARSKLCNILFCRAMARRLPPSAETYAVHPGVVASDIWRRIPQPFRWLMTRRMISNEEGAQGTLHLATAAELEAPSGAYYSRTRPKATLPLADDEQLQEELWRRSAQWCGLSPEFTS
jgi:NAD(P)-dependent dehydrogenase (short-subunit alcohol dehydrogenase family)